jgi:hypothetical protein
MQKDAECLLKNFHFYPFGGFAKTIDYIDSLMTGNTTNYNGEDGKVKDKLVG